MTTDFVKDRLTELRMKKDVSEHRMSLDLGKSKGYIHRISSGKCLPSLKELFAICDYLGVSVKDFFDIGNIEAGEITRLLNTARRLGANDLNLLNQLADRLDQARP